MKDNFNLQDLLGENDEGVDSSDSPRELKADVIKSKLPLYTTQKVAEMVVCSRYLSFDKEITVACMEELAKRREAGDAFPFESFIDTSLKALPPLNFALPDLRTMLSQFSKQGKK